MKTYFHIFLLILSTATVQPCFSSGRSEATSGVDGTVISARGALGGLEAVPSGPLYAGNGGENIRLAVLSPQIQGEVPAYLPIYIQGLLNNNFNKYSAINLIDRQNLENIIAEQKIAASGSYSENDFVKIGNLTNAQYFLFGTIQKLSGDRYSLQLSITDSTTGIRKANFMKDGSLTQLEGRGTLINEATADLLAQLGIQLTEAGKQMLLAGNTSAVKAEAGLARGITAQAGGSEVEALFNFTQAITFDPSQIEALSRLNTLSSTISGGTISQKIVTDIQARARWIEVFKETTRFFNDHPPFEIIFDPNLIQIGKTDYVKNTANIGMRIALDQSEAGFGALNALLEGLEKTGNREVWGFSGWPLIDISPKTAGTVVFGGKRSFSYKVDVALINEANKTIGNNSITLNTEEMYFSYGNRRITPPSNVEGIVSFQNVRAEDLTPTLTIVITSVNGISSRELNASGYMKIDTGDLEPREQEREVAEQQAQFQKEKEKQQAQAQKEREKREREEKRKLAEQQRPKTLWGSFGYNYSFGFPLGFTIGSYGLYTSWNFHFPTFFSGGVTSGSIPDGITGETITQGLEFTVGYSFNLIGGLLTLPIGLGMSLTDEYQYYHSDVSEGWYGNDKRFDDKKFIIEAGLQLTLIEILYLSATYRLIGFSKSGFTIGGGVILWE